MGPRREPSCSWRRNDRDTGVLSACEDVRLNLDVERHITKSSITELLAEDGRSRSRRRPDGRHVRFALGVEPTPCCSLFLSRPQAEVLRPRHCPADRDLDALICPVGDHHIESRCVTYESRLGLARGARMARSKNWRGHLRTARRLVMPNTYSLSRNWLTDYGSSDRSWDPHELACPPRSSTTID